MSTSIKFALPSPEACEVGGEATTGADPNGNTLKLEGSFTERAAVAVGVLLVLQGNDGGLDKVPDRNLCGALGIATVALMEGALLDRAAIFSRLLQIKPGLPKDTAARYIGLADALERGPAARRLESICLHQRCQGQITVGPEETTRICREFRAQFQPSPA